MPAIAGNIKKVAVIKTGEQTQFIELDQVNELVTMQQAPYQLQK